MMHEDYHLRRSDRNDQICHRKSCEVPGSHITQDSDNLKRFAVLRKFGEGVPGHSASEWDLERKPQEQCQQIN